MATQDFEVIQVQAEAVSAVAHALGGVEAAKKLGGLWRTEGGGSGRGGRRRRRMRTAAMVFESYARTPARTR
jgi:hypothetical protein